jgi:hypothetical protein
MQNATPPRAVFKNNSTLCVIHISGTVLSCISGRLFRLVSYK